LKFGINTDQAVDGMLLGIRDISWISIDVKGTKVKVDLRERVKLPEMVPKDQPCNIIAARDGMIKQIIATDGIESVLEGETVKQGQILISGRIPLKNEKDKFRLVHAMGTVKARTWYEEQFPVERFEVIKEKTGNVIRNYTLVLFAKKLDLFHKKISYNDFDKIEDKKELSIGENLIFPFELITNSFYENRITQKAIPEDDAKRAASDAAYKKAMEKVPKDAGIVKSNVKFVEDENLGLIAIVTIECLEDIGRTQEIGGN
jgi:similar to stage IV sporulation protein